LKSVSSLSTKKELEAFKSTICSSQNTRIGEQKHVATLDAYLFLGLFRSKTSDPRGMGTIRSRNKRAAHISLFQSLLESIRLIQQEPGKVVVVRARIHQQLPS
jgi:hypothetical protein